MQRLVLFTVVACSAAAPPPAPVPAARPVPRPVALLAPDAAPMPPAPGVRGAACGECTEGLRCGPLPGGYCMSVCGVVGGGCDGACVETGRMGELCMKACGRDADCRADEGYVCDPTWHACVVPNMTAIVPAVCPGDGKQDPAFGASEVLSQGPGVYQFEPAGVLADDGSAVAVWIGRGAIFEGNHLGVSRGGELGDKQSAFDPWLARDSKGRLYAVWYAFDGRDMHGAIDLAISADRGATWSAPVTVHDPADCSGEEPCLDKPMIAIGPKDVIYVMYAADDSGLRVRASKDLGKTWSKPVTALAGIYGNAVVGYDGRLHIVTIDGGPMGAYGSAQQKIEYTVSTDDGATFAKPLVVSERDEMLPFFFGNPSVAVDTARRFVYVAYVRGGRDAKWDVVLAAYDGKTWKRQVIGDGCAIHMVPNLAVDPSTGVVHVAYYDSAPPRFAHAICTVGMAKCAVLGAINSQPFAAMSTERHGSKWLGEYESLLVDDKRRVIHALWTQPIAVDGKIVSRVFHAVGKLPKR